VTRAAALRQESDRFGRRFVDIDTSHLTSEKATIVRAIRNKDWLIQQFEDNGHTRLTICRAQRAPNGQRWADGITWDELMWLKAEAGHAESWCVEVYPPDREVVDVANMRHLWVLAEPPGYGWRTLVPALTDTERVELAQKLNDHLASLGGAS